MPSTEAGSLSRSVVFRGLRPSSCRENIGLRHKNRCEFFLSEQFRPSCCLPVISEFAYQDAQRFGRSDSRALPGPGAGMLCRVYSAGSTGGCSMQLQHIATKYAFACNCQKAIQNRRF